MLNQGVGYSYHWAVKWEMLYCVRLCVAVGKTPFVRSEQMPTYFTKPFRYLLQEAHVDQI